MDNEKQQPLFQMIKGAIANTITPPSWFSGIFSRTDHTRNHDTRGNAGQRCHSEKPTAFRPTTIMDSLQRADRERLSTSRALDAGIRKRPLRDRSVDLSDDLDMSWPGKLAKLNEDGPKRVIMNNSTFGCHATQFKPQPKFQYNFDSKARRELANRSAVALRRYGGGSLPPLRRSLRFNNNSCDVESGDLNRMGPVTSISDTASILAGITPWPSDQSGLNNRPGTDEQRQSSNDMDYLNEKFPFRKAPSLFDPVVEEEEVEERVISGFGPRSDAGVLAALASLPCVQKMKSFSAAHDGSKGSSSSYGMVDASFDIDAMRTIVREEIERANLNKSASSVPTWDCFACFSRNPTTTDICECCKCSRNVDQTSAPMVIVVPSTTAVRKPPIQTNAPDKLFDAVSSPPKLPATEADQQVAPVSSTVTLATKPDDAHISKSSFPPPAIIPSSFVSTTGPLTFNFTTPTAATVSETSTLSFLSQMTSASNSAVTSAISMNISPAKPVVSPYGMMAGFSGSPLPLTSSTPVLPSSLSTVKPVDAVRSTNEATSPSVFPFATTAVSNLIVSSSKTEDRSRLTPFETSTQASPSISSLTTAGLPGWSFPPAMSKNNNCAPATDFSLPTSTPAVSASLVPSTAAPTGLTGFTFKAPLITEPAVSTMTSSETMCTPMFSSGNVTKTTTFSFGAPKLQDTASTQSSTQSPSSNFSLTSSISKPSQSGFFGQLQAPAATTSSGFNFNMKPHSNGTAASTFAGFTGTTSSASMAPIFASSTQPTVQQSNANFFNSGLTAPSFGFSKTQETTSAAPTSTFSFSENTSGVFGSSFGTGIIFPKPVDCASQPMMNSTLKSNAPAVSSLFGSGTASRASESPSMGSDTSPSINGAQEFLATMKKNSELSATPSITPSFFPSVMAPSFGSPSSSMTFNSLQKPTLFSLGSSSSSQATTTPSNEGGKLFLFSGTGANTSTAASTSTINTSASAPPSIYQFGAGLSSGSSVMKFGSTGSTTSFPTPVGGEDVDTSNPFNTVNLGTSGRKTKHPRKQLKH